MPELPEVEVVRRGADKWFKGRRVKSVVVHHPRAVRRQTGGATDFAARLSGTTLTTSARRGKYLWYLLDSDDALVVHLGMSGQIRVTPPSEDPHRHERIRLQFHDDGPDLAFLDQRTFGGLFIDETTPGADTPESVRHIGRDPLDDEFVVLDVARAMTRRRSAVKAVLLDQTVVSGIGNIYADEALFRARVHWNSPADSLSVRAHARLLREAQAVMTEALAAGGTSFDSLYVNVNGSSGYFSRSLNAYGREGEPCSRCGATIVRESFANRSSFRCPRCQRQQPKG